MKKLLLSTFLLLLTIAAFSQKLPAEKIIGIWQNEGGDVGLKFEFFASDGKYFGRLLWASTMYEADGKTPKKDPKNPIRNLRGRSRQHLVNVTNLRYEDGEYTGGKLYNPDDGHTYSVNAKLVNDNLLEFRAYLGLSVLGRTMKFNRIK